MGRSSLGFSIGQFLRDSGRAALFLAPIVAEREGPASSLSQLPLLLSLLPSFRIMKFRRKKKGEQNCQKKRTYVAAAPLNDAEKLGRGTELS